MHRHTPGSLAHHFPHCPHCTNKTHGTIITTSHVLAICIILHCTHLNDSSALLLWSSGVGVAESGTTRPEGGAITAI